MAIGAVGAVYTLCQVASRADSSIWPRDGESLGPEVLTDRFEDGSVDLSRVHLPMRGCGPHGKGYMSPRMLALRGVALSEKSWEQIRALDPEELVLEGCTGVTEGGLQLLTKNKNIIELRRLTLKACPGFTGQELSGLNYRSLPHLHLDSLMDFDETNLKYLEEVTWLYALELTNLPIRGSGLGSLKRISGLREIRLKGLTLDSRELGEGIFPSSFTTLSVEYINFENGTPDFLKGVEQLKELCMNSVDGLTMNDYRALGNIERLQRISMRHCSGLDKSLATVLEKATESELGYIRLTFLDDQVPNGLIREFKRLGPVDVCDYYTGETFITLGGKWVAS